MASGIIKVEISVVSAESKAKAVKTYRNLDYWNITKTYFAINISDKKSRRFDLSEVIFKCIKAVSYTHLTLPTKRIV